MTLIDVASVKFDEPQATSSRAARLGNLKIMGAGRWHAPVTGRPAARFIAVHGRTGAGKSTIAANLAIALAGLRSRVVLIELDIERPSIHRTFGVNNPVHGLKALLHRQIETMEEALSPTSVRNLYLVSAEGTAVPTAPTEPERQHRLLEQIWELDADIVIADIGAGPGSDLVDLFALGALRLLVTTPAEPCLRRAYSLLRSEVIREIEHVAGGTPEGDLLIDGLLTPKPRPLREIMTHAPHRPNVRAAVEHALESFGARMIGNQTGTPEQADVLHAASRLIADYLQVSVPVLGILEASPQFASGAASRPLLLGSGVDHNVRLFHAMAEQLVIDVDEMEAARCVAMAPPERHETGGESPPRHHTATDDAVALPNNLDPYLRRHTRHRIDWIATFTSDGGRKVPVRVFEVSVSGASAETLPGLEVGERGTLTFTQLIDEPVVRATVMNTRTPLGRVGFRFDDPDGLGARLAAIASDRRRT